MPAPIFRLPATGVDPKVTTKQLLESNVNAVLSALYGEIATIATGLNPRGGWDASSGAFPSGSKKGDYWIVSDAGTMDGQGFIVGDWVVALVNNASTSTYAENWFRADYSTVTPKEYATIAELALADDAIDGMTKAVVDGFNGEREYFTFVAGGNLTADGALVVDGVGGQWVSKRTVYADWVELNADPRNPAVGTAVQYNGYQAEVVASGGVLMDGGIRIQPKPFAAGKYCVAQVGVLDNSSDGSTAVAALINAIPDGSELHFDGTKEYLLNIAATKEIRLQFNGSSVVPFSNDADCINISPDPATITTYAVSETEIEYGSTEFTVVGASGNFNVGDIGTLHDGALRGDGQPVNYLTVKIAAITGDVITIDGFTRSHMGVTDGAITFRHSTAQMKDAGVVDVAVLMPSGNEKNAVFMTDIERPIYDKIKTKGTTGKGLSLRYVYDIRGGTYEGSEPRSTGSGEGYGLQLLAASEGFTGPCRGVGMRHAFDSDSVYGISIGLVSDPDAVSSPLTFAHNGFAGHLRIAGVQGVCRGGAYPITGSGQGYGTGSLRPAKEKHLFRNVSVGRADVTMRGLDPNDFAALVYFQNGVIDCDPGVVSFRMEDQTSVGAAAASVAVRVNGPIIGDFPITVSGDRIGYVFWRSDDHGYAGRQGTMRLVSANVESCRMVAFVRGGGVFKGGPVVIDSAVSEPLYQFDIIGGNVLDRVVVETPEYDATNRQIVAANTVTEGSISHTQRSSGASISSPNGRVLTQSEIQNRSGWMRIVADTGAGTDTLGAFPPPIFNGQTLIVHAWNSGRKDVTIPAGTGVLSDIAFNSTTPMRTLRGYAGKWVAS